MVSITCTRFAPQREIIHVYFTKLTAHPIASTFVYEINDKVYAVCCGIILVERNEFGDTVKRFYVKDLFSSNRTQKKVHIVERLIRFGKNALKQTDVTWMEEKGDFFKYRTKIFGEMVFESIINEN